VAATKIKVIELAKELGVTSKDLMLAAEEMGTKGVRAMTPLDTTLANALRVKLGKGRDLPEEPKPKRPARAKTAAPAEGDDAAKLARTRKKAGSEEEVAPVDIKPAATIVKPKPVEPQEAPEPLAPVAEILQRLRSPWSRRRLLSFLRRRPFRGRRGPRGPNPRSCRIDPSSDRQRRRHRGQDSGIPLPRRAWCRGPRVRQRRLRFDVPSPCASRCGRRRLLLHHPRSPRVRRPPWPSPRRSRRWRRHRRTSSASS